jgi:hypothetical protein
MSLFKFNFTFDYHWHDDSYVHFMIILEIARNEELFQINRLIFSPRKLFNVSFSMQVFGERHRKL